jgi:hypothetical protein
LGDGRVLEFESPDVLLSNDESELSLLVKQTGSAEAEHLRMMANSTLRNGLNVEEHTHIDTNDEMPYDAAETDRLL